ncbi:MAG: hypothetical protein RXO54_07860 [Acidilobus sp.]
MARDETSTKDDDVREAQQEPHLGGQHGNKYLGGRYRQRPLGESLPDWQIIIRLANAMGYGDYFRYSSPEDVWNEIRSAWPAVYGITYGRLEREGGLPYPTPRLDALPVKVLYEKEFGVGRRARLRPVAYIPPPEQPSKDYLLPEA